MERKRRKVAKSVGIKKAEEHIEGHMSKRLDLKAIPSNRIRTHSFC